MQLFCPKCGNRLSRNESGELECESGQMVLSQALEQRLLDCYVKQIHCPRDITFPFTIGGNWFCPGCGVSIPESSPGDLDCPICSRSLVEFIYVLVELHPHLNGY